MYHAVRLANLTVNVYRCVSLNTYVCVLVYNVYIPLMTHIWTERNKTSIKLFKYLHNIVFQLWLYMCPGDRSLVFGDATREGCNWERIMWAIKILLICVRVILLRKYYCSLNSPGSIKATINNASFEEWIFFFTDLIIYNSP